MTKRLALTTEHLAPLTGDEPRIAAGAAVRDMTGHVRCVLSLERWCVTHLCTVAECLGTGAGS